MQHWGTVAYRNCHFIITLETAGIFPSCWIESLPLSLWHTLSLSSVPIAFMSNYPCEVVTECKLIMKKTDTGKERERSDQSGQPSTFPNYTAVGELPLADWSTN